MAERQFTRQLATILSIDAAGYSRLMGMDDEEALDAFQERARLITSECQNRGGRMFGDAGDSLMAEFGSAIDAFRAATSFQKALIALNREAADGRRMHFRVGINTGDVIVIDGKLFGQEVNIAARLQELAPEAGVVISETAWNHVDGKTAWGFADLGEQDLKNINMPIRAYLAVSEDGGDGAGSVRAAPVPAGSSPAVAVLPLRAAGRANEDLDYLGEAVAEDIIAGLANVRWLSVIAASSSFQFDGTDLPPAAAARALGARYVVSGRIRAGAGNIRLSLDLEDARTGRAVWSRQFETGADALRDLQAEAGEEIVALLSAELDRAEQARAFRLPYEKAGVWQLVARGRYHMARRTSEDTAIALELFNKALTAEPNSTAALNELAWWHFWQGFVAADGSHYDEVIALSNKAMFMDSQDARPHAHLGAVQIMRRDPEGARRHLQEAIRINPSFAFARSAMGSALLLSGDAAGSLSYFRDAERLSPFDLYAFHNLGEIASAQVQLGQWEPAVETARRSLSLSPGYWYARFLLAGALARLGRHEDAGRQARSLHERDPGFSVQFAERIPFSQRAAIDLIVQNFRLAEGSQG